MSIYTKAGDNGTSGTLKQTRLPKNSLIFSLVGTLDELGACLGIAKNQLGSGQAQIVEALQTDLLLLSSEFVGGKTFATNQQIASLENAIDLMMQAAPLPTEFVLAGKTTAGSALHLARTIARRAERELVAKKMSGGISKEAAMYMNRLSDFLFALANLVDSAKPTVKTGFVSLGKSDNDFLDTALWLCKKVMEKAEAQNIKVVTAACDAGGNLAALLRADGAYIASIDIAANKAFTSVALQMPTENLETLAAPGGSLYGIQDTNKGRIVIFAGGIPLAKNTEIIGGFGVSGGTAEQDKELAHYAAEVFSQHGA